MLAVAFLHGLISSLSACVYPLIPITTALFGAGVSRNLAQGFLVSFIYVMGMAFTYVALGVVAALMGSIFGAWMASPQAILVFAIVFFYLGLAFAGLLPLPLPNFAEKLQVKKTSSILYPLLLGIFSGFIAAPCTAPFFGGTLAQIAGAAAQEGSVLPGVLQALAFSFGMGLPFLLIGGFAMRLPKPGNWLVAVKYFGAVVLITAGYHYLEDLFAPFPENKSNLVVAFMGLVIAILFFLLAEPLKDMTVKSRWMKFQSAIWLAIAAFGLFLATTPISVLIAAGTSPKRTAVQADLWYSDMVAGKKAAREKQGPILIDFWAEWCTACHEMDARLFQAKEFKELVQLYRVTLVRLDFTEPSSDLEKLAEKYGIRGLPTLVLTDSNGEMFEALIGFYSKKASLRDLNYALKNYSGNSANK